MNSRGQAALEYLMTYGWALIVIAIVVGVLVFIVATPTGSMNCTSTGPGRINVVSNNLRDGSILDTGTTTGIGSIVITNLTGGLAEDVTITGSSLFEVTQTDYTGTQDLAVGDTTLNPIPGAVSGSPYTSGTLTIAYTDTVGLDQTSTITCQGASITVIP